MLDTWSDSTGCWADGYNDDQKRCKLARRTLTRDRRLGSPANTITG